MSLRKMSARSEQGNAVHITECNNEAVFKIVPEEAQKTMRDAVIMGGKKAAIWVCDFGQQSDSLDLRFATMWNSLVSGEHWSVHRLVCVPRNPERDTDEWEMLQSFYTMMYQEAEWAGASQEAFATYLKQEGLL